MVTAFGITKKPKKKREGGKNRVLKLFNCPDPNCSKRFNKDSELRVHDNKHHKSKLSDTSIWKKNSYKFIKITSNCKCINVKYNNMDHIIVLELQK